MDIYIKQELHFTLYSYVTGVVEKKKKILVINLTNHEPKEKKLLKETVKIKSGESKRVASDVKTDYRLYTSDNFTCFISAPITDKDGDVWFVFTPSNGKKNE